MKKALTTLIVFGFIISCVEEKNVTDVEDYVNQINNRSDLTETVTEFTDEDLKTNLMSELTIRELKDSNGKVYRIYAEFLQKDKTPTAYKFYFKNDTLQLAKVLELDKTGKDTTVNSEYYFDGSKLLKRIDRKEDNLDAETIQQLSAFYLVFSKETSK